MLDENRWRDFSFSQLKAGSHIHLIGICGTAMASLAGILQDQGFKVTGSDENPYPPMSTQLENIGIKIIKGYKRENLAVKPDLVIVGNVITRNHEEAKALLESEIPYTSLPVAMGEFVIADRLSVVVTGTHGKTTTTSLLAWMAEICGQKPGYLIGGIPKNFGKSFASPKADLFVIEGDEYDTAFFDKVPKFVHYKPKFVILSSIEFDHADIYSGVEQIREEFRKLIRLIPAEGVLVVHQEIERIEELTKDCKGKVVFYGAEPSSKNQTMPKADYRYEKMPGGVRVSNSSAGVESEMHLYGEYNLQNAGAAVALALEMGWEKEKVEEALRTFAGVKRRQEIIGQPNDILVIEDFAHHPTAVKMTIDAVQTHFADRKVISVFEPRSAASRRKIFQDDYAESFKTAQRVLVAQPYNQTNIAENDRFSSHELVKQLRIGGVNADFSESVDQLVDALRSEARSGDVILIMSNGGFDGLYQKLLKVLSDT